MIDAPLHLHDTDVKPEWVDYNGHMSESCYLLAFGDSADAFFRYIGIDEAYRAAGHSLYTSRRTCTTGARSAEGEPLELTLQVLDLDGKRVHIFHEMRHGDTGRSAGHRRAAAGARRHGGRSVGGHAGRAARAARRDPEAHAPATLPRRRGIVGRPMGIRHATRNDRTQQTTHRQAGSRHGLRAGRRAARDRRHGRARSSRGSCIPHEEEVERRERRAARSWPPRSGQGDRRPGSTRRTCRRSSAAAGSTR